MEDVGAAVDCAVADGAVAATGAGDAAGAACVTAGAGGGEGAALAGLAAAAPSAAASGRGRCTLWSVVQIGDHRAHGNRVARGVQYLRDYAGKRRGQIDRRLVALDLDEVFVLADRLAFALQPSADLNFLDRFPYRGNLDFLSHARQ